MKRSCMESYTVQTNELNKQIEEILRGSFDLHVHAGPDAYQARRMDALDTARVAHEAEMAGFVLKSHQTATANLATTLNRVYPGLMVEGSITLNREVGGLNCSAIESAAKLGATVVWMPTYSAEFSFDKLKQNPHLADEYKDSFERGSGFKLISDDGNLIEQVLDVIDVIKFYDLVIASGHVSPVETIALFQEAKAQGVERMIATNPVGIATFAELQAIVETGAFVEHTFLSCMPGGSKNPQELVASVRKLGVEHCVVTTNFGQPSNPPPAEGMRMAIAILLETGLTGNEITALIKDNPLRLVRR